MLLTDKYTIERHFETFDYMAERIAPYVDRCLFSFVVWYKKLHMPELLPISEQQKDQIAKGLGEIAPSTICIFKHVGQRKAMSNTASTAAAA